jgi:hypothetical protein
MTRSMTKFLINNSYSGILTFFKELVFFILSILIHGTLIKISCGEAQISLKNGVNLAFVGGKNVA